MTARVGPVAAKFSGRILLSDIVAPTSYTHPLRRAGWRRRICQRRGAGVAWRSEGIGTRIDYTAKAQVGGKLAQIGSRLVDGAAAKVADDFFARFVERLGGGRATGEAVPASAGVPTVDAAAATRRMWLRMWLAVAILAAMTIYWLTRTGRRTFRTH